MSDEEDLTVWILFAIAAIAFFLDLIIGGTQ